MGDDEPDLATAILTGLTRIAHAITPSAMQGHDETGGTVASLTEAIMGVTAGLCRVASAIDGVAEKLDAIDTSLMAVADVANAIKERP